MITAAATAHQPPSASVKDLRARFSASAHSTAAADNAPTFTDVAAPASQAATATATATPVVPRSLVSALSSLFDGASKKNTSATDGKLAAVAPLLPEVSVKDLRRLWEHLAPAGAAVAAAADGPAGHEDEIAQAAVADPWFATFSSGFQDRDAGPARAATAVSAAKAADTASAIDSGADLIAATGQLQHACPEEARSEPAIACQVRTELVGGRLVHEIDLRCAACQSVFVVSAVHACHAAPAEASNDSTTAADADGTAARFSTAVPAAAALPAAQNSPRTTARPHQAVDEGAAIVSGVRGLGGEDDEDDTRERGLEWLTDAASRTDRLRIVL
ncbi:hypothetical protein HK405_003371 [Cladochytrium tenue]|nr:hypothetical protein HK405_003371 [Cladochytrium tenue]